MIFRCLRHSVPRYLSDFCTPVANVAARSQLRSARRHLVVVPRYNRSTYGRRAFSVAGPMTWNSLTDSLRDPSLSTDSFRHQFKTFLFSNPTVCIQRIRDNSVDALYKSTFYLLTYLLTHLFKTPVWKPIEQCLNTELLIARNQ